MSEIRHEVRIVTGRAAFVHNGRWTGDEPLRSLCKALSNDRKLFPPNDYIPDVDWDLVQVIAKHLDAEFFPKNKRPEKVLRGAVQ